MGKIGLNTNWLGKKKDSLVYWGEIMGRVKELYLDKLESRMCNDCPKSGDNIVTFKNFPDIIVCDSCFTKYYVERDDANPRYR